MGERTFDFEETEQTVIRASSTNTIYKQHTQLDTCTRKFTNCFHPNFCRNWDSLLWRSRLLRQQRRQEIVRWVDWAMKLFNIPSPLVSGRDTACASLKQCCR